MLSFWIFETSKSGALNHHTWNNVQTLQKRLDLLFPFGCANFWSVVIVFVKTLQNT